MAIHVNGELVSSHAVVTELTRLVRFYHEHVPGEDLEENRELLIRKAKDQAIGARLLLSEARKAEVRVSEAETRTRRQALVAEAGGEAAFQEMLDGRGLEEAEFHRSLVDGLMIDKLVAALVARIPEPTEAEATALLDKLRAGGQKVTVEQARDLLTHEKRGRVIAECVALLRQKAVVEDDDDFDGADIDAIFDSYLDDGERA